MVDHAIGARLRGPPFHSTQTKFARVAREEHGADAADRSHSRQLSDARHGLAIQRRAPIPLQRIAETQRGSQYPRRAESGVDRLDRKETAYQETGAGQQVDCQRHLRHHERTAHRA
jgi:hypothetical protein